MKTVIVGDTHGRSFWKLIVHKENPDKVIFIGDYFDSFDISGLEQIHNFKEIIEYKKSGKVEVIMLIGNHDDHYINGNTGTSGYQYGIAPSIIQVISENKQHLQMAYSFDKYLCSHAGVSEEFIHDLIGSDISKFKSNLQVAEFINESYKYKPIAFQFNGVDNSGNDTYQTPIWIRPYALMKASKNFSKFLIQIVGHTTMKKIDVSGKATDGRYYFIDTLGTSREYLIIEDNKISVGKI